MYTYICAEAFFGGGGGGGGGGRLYIYLPPQRRVRHCLIMRAIVPGVSFSTCMYEVCLIAIWLFEAGR